MGHIYLLEQFITIEMGAKNLSIKDELIREHCQRGGQRACKYQRNKRRAVPVTSLQYGCLSKTYRIQHQLTCRYDLGEFHSTPALEEEREVLNGC